MTREEKRMLQILQAKEEREKKIAYYNTINCACVPHAGIDSGARGKARELELTPDAMNRNKESVSSAGKMDFKIAYEKDGKKTWRKAECKTNGGRIDEMLDTLKKGRDSIVIYELDICNSSTSGLRRHTKPKIFKTSVFIQILTDCGAIKKVNKNGSFDGYAIQASSKKLFIAIDDYPLAYDKNRTYSDDDFELVSIDIED